MDAKRMHPAGFSASGRGNVSGRGEGEIGGGVCVWRYIGLAFARKEDIIQGSESILTRFGYVHIHLITM